MDCGHRTFRSALHASTSRLRLVAALGLVAGLLIISAGAQAHAQTPDGAAVPEAPPPPTLRAGGSAPTGESGATEAPVASVAASVAAPAAPASPPAAPPPAPTLGGSSPAGVESLPGQSAAQVPALTAGAGAPDGDGERGGMQTAAALVRSLNYAGMMLAVGGVAFLLLVHDRRVAERGQLIGLVMLGVALAAGGSVLGVFVQGPFVTGLGIGAMLDPGMLSTVLATSYGDAVVMRLTGLGVLLISLPYLWNRWAIIASGIAGSAVIASFVVAASYSPDLPYWLVVASSLSHKLSAAAWFGGLILLIVAMRKRRAQNDVAGGALLVSRFSMFATGSIVLVTVAGLGMTWVRVPTLADLFGTSYGWVLIAKVVVFALVLAVGGYNHHFLVPIIAEGRGAADAWRRMERLVRIEVVGIAVVVLVTVALIQLTPAPRDNPPASLFATTTELAQGHWLELAVDPGDDGWGDLTVQLRRPDGSPLDDVSQPTLALYLPAGEVMPLAGTPEKVGPGTWTLRDQLLPPEDGWWVGVRARTTTAVRLAADVPVTLAR